MTHLFGYLNLEGAWTKKALFYSAALLFIYSACIYSKSIHNEFVWDSFGVITEDPMIRDTANIWSFFTQPLILGTAGDLGEGLEVNVIKYYRPLLSTLHTFEYALLGESPIGYKIVNILLNSLVVVFGFLVINKISKSTATAFLASLIYASIPVRAEAVYWVYSDSHIISALFSLAAFWAYMHARHWLSIFLVIIGLLFQESGVFIPLILVSYEVTRDSKYALSKRLAKTAPFWVLSALYLIARQYLVGKTPSSSLDYWSLLKAAGYQTWEHTRIFFSPDGPATVYLYQEGMFSPGGSASALGTFALLFFGTVAFLLWRYRKEDCFWYFWFLALIVVSFNIGAYGDYLMAEKTLYLAALGLSVLMVKLLLSVKRFQTAGLTIICGVFLFNSAQIYARADSWTNTSTYLARVLKFEPNFEIGLIQGGNTALLEGRYQVASNYYFRVLLLRPELKPSIGKNYVESILRQAQNLSANGENEQAILIMKEATTVIKDNSALYNGLGIVHYHSGNLPEAKRNWMFALKIDPNNDEALSNLGLLSDS